MTASQRHHVATTEGLPRPPLWATTGRAETVETVAFRSGAVLSCLDQRLRDPDQIVPRRLLSNRLALSAAVTTSQLEGRMAGLPDLRDALCFAIPDSSGEPQRGPDGDLLAFWRAVAQVDPTRKDAQAVIATLVGANFREAVPLWLQAAQERAAAHGPLAACTDVLRDVLQADDRAERVACALADVALAQSMRWPCVLPVTVQLLKSAHFRRLDAADGRLAIQQRILQSVNDTITLSAELARRAQAVRAVAPKLRSKASEAAVALFLTEDAIAPSAMLSPVVQGTATPMTGRAARRLCDRLVALDVAYELTGRSSFRLYGIMP